MPRPSLIPNLWGFISKLAVSPPLIFSGSCPASRGGEQIDQPLYVPTWVMPVRNDMYWEGKVDEWLSAQSVNPPYLDSNRKTAVYEMGSGSLR